MQTATIETPASRDVRALPAVRVATVEDLPQILEMCREIYREIGFSKVDWEKVHHGLMRGIEGQVAIIGVIGDPGKLEGMIALHVSTMWYSSEPHLEETLNFVRAPYRRSQNAKALINFAKEMSNRLGLPLLIGIVSNKQTEQKVRLYRRQLGEPAGAFFLHGGKTGK